MFTHNCHQCGKENQPNAQYCRYCGTQLANPYQATATAKSDFSKPFNWLAPAIFATLFCCNILGVVSVVYASRVDVKWSYGDYQGAIQSAKNAQIWF